MKVEYQRCSFFCIAQIAACRCEETLGGESGTRFTLPKLNGLHFIHTLIIHTCDLLIIPNGTFDGVVFHQLIKLVAIKQVVLSPWTFRGILRSPHELIIQEANFHRIPKNAFSGLSNLKHIWFRNATIGSIAARAFEHNFSGKMHEVENFFIRGNVRIRSLGAMVFSDSQIAQLVFEDVRMSTNELCFIGVEVNKLMLMRCRWRNRRTRHLSRFISQSIDHVHLINTTVDRLALSTFFNSTKIQIDQSTIAELSPATSNLRARSIYFFKSTIKQITSNAFHNINSIELLEVVQSKIGIISERAFRNANIETLLFDKSSIDQIHTTSFEKTRIRTLQWSECEIGGMSANIFLNTIIQQILISKSKVTSIANNCFADLILATFLIVDSKMSQIGSSPFANVQVENLTLHNNEFTFGDFGTIFAQLGVLSLTATNNVFGCDPNDCETNALLLNNDERYMPWYFENNRCLKSHGKEICKRELEWTDRGGVHCRGRHQIVECVCDGDTTSDKSVQLPQTNASILLIGDCIQLHINSASTSRVTSLHIYRIETLQLLRLPPRLKTLQIFHSRVHFINENAFAYLNMDRVEVIATHINTIERYAFRDSSVKTFILRDSALLNAERHAFGSSSIENFYAEICKFYRVDNLWSYLNNVSIRQSFVDNPIELMRLRTFCFEDSDSACECVPDEFIERNRCETRIESCPESDISVENWQTKFCMKADQHNSGTASVKADSNRRFSVLLIPDCNKLAAMIFLLYRFAVVV
ncbi:unnamed protein product [Anisakis simplex]|uniref:Recep_L_domain domain-containing protein n=1 Tax=Anisakis simplex TaxID=6269 RepID=A0A0M3JVC0_ANISI|nr:unnamed protein product [Anisakis simplex]